MTAHHPDDIEAANEWIRSLVAMRQMYGLTQREVAARMGDKVSQGDVSRLETGADYRASTLIRYARAIGLHLRLTMHPVEDDE